MGLEGGFGPQDWNLGLEAGIWASRLRYGPGGWGEGGGTREGKEKEEEKIAHMCESIGHRPPSEPLPKKKERSDAYWGLQSTTDERYTVVHTMNVD